MGMKRVVILALLVTLIGVVSAAECNIVQETSCSDSIVMYLSSPTNAHGATWDQAVVGYNDVLCCDFAGTHSCTGSNRILRLSSPTNAHAEIPENSGYTTNVCFGDLVCRSASSCTPPNEAEILSLSANTNAHIGGPGVYPVKICCEGIVAPSCDITSASWSTENAVEDESVTLTVTGDNCNGEAVSFEVWEEDFIGDDLFEGIGPDDATFSGTTATSTWTAVWESDEYDIISGDNDPEYFFRATASVSGDSKDSDNLLSVTVKNCTGINFCSDYKTQGACEADGTDSGCEVDIIVGEGIDCDDPGVTCECTWDPVEECVPSSSFSECGNGVVNIGEECDEGIEDFSCSDFGLSGDGLECGPDCHFDTSQCTGGTTGPCGNDIINLGESCDGGLNGFSCENFDEFDNALGLTCDPVECHFDTSLCTINSGHTTPGLGKCLYPGTSDYDCSDGGTAEYSINAKVDWPSDNGWNLAGCVAALGDSNLCTEFVQTANPNFDGQFHYDPPQQDGNTLFETCRPQEISIACPAQVQLPFFSWQTLIVTIIVIAVIYWAWSSKEKGKPKKKSKSKKK